MEPAMKSSHMADIQTGAVTGTNIRGIRLAINANERRRLGLSTSRTSPRLTSEELDLIEAAIDRIVPQVVGALHDSGVAVLTSRRNRKQLEKVEAIIKDLASIHLVRFDRIGTRGAYATPVYLVLDTEGRSFMFRNVPWQSGGNGPELV
jgi:hypothetical protein